MNEKTTPLTDNQMNERTLHLITKHQRGLKILTGAALGLWLVAMAGSLLIIFGYFVTYLPRENELMRLEKKVQDASASAVSSNESGKMRGDQRQVMLIMTRVVGMGMVSTAICVAVLSAGMLATIILVIWNRRVTLRQINANLTQISAQLKELERRER